MKSRLTAVSLSVMLGIAMTAAPAVAQEDEVGISATGVQENISALCCGKEQAAGRRRCMNSVSKDLLSVKSVLGRDFVTDLVSYIKGLKESDCDLSSSPTSKPKPKKDDCDVNRKNSDGFGGFLYKGVADVGHMVVVLFPAGQNPNGCRLESKAGKKLSDFSYNGTSNPDRPTWRGGYCQSMPENSVLKCQYGKKTHCWKIPEPCGRYD